MVVLGTTIHEFISANEMSYGVRWIRRTPELVDPRAEREDDEKGTPLG
jgi:hypothetical protein